MKTESERYAEMEAAWSDPAYRIKRADAHLTRYRQLAAIPVCHCDYRDIAGGPADNCHVRREHGKHQSAIDAAYFHEIIESLQLQRIADQLELNEKVRDA